MEAWGSCPSLRKGNCSERICFHHLSFNWGDEKGQEEGTSLKSQPKKSPELFTHSAPAFPFSEEQVAFEFYPWWHGSPTLLGSPDLLLPSPTHRECIGELWMDPFSLTISTILKACPWKGGWKLALKIPPRRGQLLAACSIWRGPSIRTWGYGRIASELVVRGTTKLRQDRSKQSGLGRGFSQGVFLAALPVSWFWTIRVALGRVLGPLLLSLTWRSMTGMHSVPPWGCWARCSQWLRVLGIMLQVLFSLLGMPHSVFLFTLPFKSQKT